MRNRRTGAQPQAIMTRKPPLAMAAPAYPLSRACDELVGRPKYQVMMFQMMAPVRPPRMAYWFRKGGAIRPLRTVFAAGVPKVKAATKLKKAAQATACVGVRTRVETMVAMELAASWKPLRKSN